MQFSIAKPEEVGVSSAALSQTLDYLAQRRVALHSLLVAVAPNVWVLYLAQILCGLGNLLLFSILAAMAIRYIPQENKSTAMGLFQALYGIGMTIGPLLLSNMVAAWNYRTAYLVFGAIAVVSLILAAVTLPMLAHRMEGKRAQ